MPLLTQFAAISKLRISPGSQVTRTSKGRQHTSQSVTNCWLATLVSIINSDACPQNGHWMDSWTCTEQDSTRGREEEAKYSPFG